MKKFNHDIGVLGENLCMQYLQLKGYKILERNFSCKIGEIDIIAMDKEIMCFVEVKSRYNMNYGFPIESITLRKQHKIAKTAEYYIIHNNIKGMNFRFDVMELLLNINHSSPEISLIKDAFRIG